MSTTAMIDPRAMGQQIDMMRASIALDVLRLPNDGRADVNEIRAAAIETLKGILSP